jgi:protein-S-isoprenylcysteine O-methyltransferase Ste14
MAELGRVLFRYRNALGPVLLILALFVGRPIQGPTAATLDPALDIAGVLIAFAGQALRILTIGYEYIDRGGRNRKVYASKLVQRGVFAHCRNPLYVGNILLACGFALVVNSYAFYVIVLPATLLAYKAIVTAEEEYLRRAFGAEYEDYCRRVDRWWLRWAGWRASIQGIEFSWARVIVKEYNTLFISFGLLFGLKIWSDHQAGKGVPSADYLALALVAWLLLYLAVRALKKRGILQA